MNVKCSRTALFEAVQLASSIVPARTPKPILQCAKITADEKNRQLTVETSDNEVTVKHVITQVQVAAAGTAVARSGPSRQRAPPKVRQWLSKKQAIICVVFL